MFHDVSERFLQVIRTARSDNDIKNIETDNKTLKCQTSFDENKFLTCSKATKRVDRFRLLGHIRSPPWLAVVLVQKLK